MISALLVLSVLDFLVTFAKMSWVLQFELLKLQLVAITKAINDFFLFDFLSKKTICVTHRKAPSIKYVRKIYRKINISLALIRARTCAYQGVKNATFSIKCTYILYEWPLTLFL